MLVNQFLEESVQQYPDKVALIYKNRKLTYAEIDSFSNSLAHALLDLGLQKQDRSAIFLENSVESVISIFGILKASGIFVAIHPHTNKRKAKYILRDCQVKILITDKKHFEKLFDVISDCSHLKAILLIDDESNHPLVSSFSDTLKNYPSTSLKSHCIDVDLASLIYTSGSTGKAKGVMLTHLNMMTAANSIIEYLENRSDDIILDILPLSFDYGLYQILMGFKFGGTVVLDTSVFYPYQIIDLLIKDKVTGFPLVPTIAAILFQMKHLDHYDFSHLRYISSTAQTLAPKHIAHLVKLFPSTKIYSMYGLTECKRVSYLHPDELLKRPTSVGKAMPNTEVYLVNETGEKITESDEVGELVVRGAHIMKGYWNLPEETAMVLKPGRYLGEKVLYTGDLFRMDSEGYLYFVTRKDDIIKTAGEKVSPKEVEDVLYELEDVLEAGVIGVPDEILGHAIKAVVVLKKNSSLDEKTIIRYCANNLDSCMIPKYVEIRQSLPKTPTGKILKRELLDESSEKKNVLKNLKDSA